MVEDLAKYSRRDIIKMATLAGGSVLAPGFLDHLLIPIAEQHDAWTKADVSNDQFLEENKRKLQHITIGGSYSPEQVSFLNTKTGRSHNSLDILKFIVEELHIKDLRLGIRWSHAMPQEDTVNISYYRPSLNYCLKAGVKLCETLGPKKTFRWPEQHIPYFLKGNLPKKTKVITPDLEIAKTAMEYLDMLLNQLDLEYGKDLRKNTPIIQLENEPFVPFGEYKWIMSEQYLESLLAITQPYFPQSKFLFNSGPFAVEPVSSLFDKLAKKGIKLVYGTDYYTHIDDYTNPYNWLYQLPLIRDLDLVTLAKIVSRPIQPTSQADFETEVTEAQFEGWGRREEPGNSVRHFKYLILRCMNDILDMDANHHYVIRLWGLEAFAQKIMSGENTKEHQDIFELIHAINYRSDKNLKS